MRSAAIEKIVDRLEKEIQLSKLTALDFFAREGDWQTFYYASKVLRVHAWEIDPKFEKNLRKNLPTNAEIVIGDSFETLKTNSHKFDMVVLDNPQGCFGKNQNLCEHFEALPLVLNHIADTCIIIFNVKTEPFDYDDKLEWQKRRNEFYGVEASILRERFVFNFYKRFFETRGLDVVFQFWEIRPQEMGLYSFVSCVKRRSHV